MRTTQIAWRNLCRNRRRTAVTAAALALNAAVLVFSYALRSGLIVAMRRDATRISVGDLQVHAAGYLQDRSIHAAIPDAPAVLADARAAGLRAAPRAFGQALVSCGDRAVGARVWGVDPVAERETFDLAGRVAAGAFLGDAPGRRVVLGGKLARALRAGVGSDVVLVAPAADGSLGNDLYRVVGVLGPAGDEVDRRAAIVDAADFGELFVAGGKVHEIALRGREGRSPEAAAALLSARHPGVEVRTWRELLPHLASLIGLWEATIWVFGVIFSLAAVAAVANTMLMATWERTREFGIQKALGATPRRILLDVSAEALLLAGIATLAGAAAGGAAVAWFHVVGLDVGPYFPGAISFSGVVFDPVMRPVLSIRVVALPVVLLVAASVLAALVPAFRAARTEPARTLAEIR